MTLGTITLGTTTLGTITLIVWPPRDDAAMVSWLCSVLLLPKVGVAMTTAPLDGLVVLSDSPVLESWVVTKTLPLDSVLVLVP